MNESFSEIQSVRLPTTTYQPILSQLLDLYWQDKRLLLSTQTAAAQYVQSSDESGLSTELHDDLARLLSLLRRSYSLGVEDQDAYLALEPYRLSSQFLSQARIPSLKQLLIQYPFFLDLYQYCRSHDSASVQRVADLYHRNRRCDLAFTALTELPNSLEQHFHYLSSIITHINLFYSPYLPIIATQAAWHWTRIELAFRIYSRLLFLPALDKRVSDHASRIFMYLALPGRADSVFHHLLSLHKQSLDSIPFTLLSTSIYLLVSSQYQPKTACLTIYVDAVRSHRLALSPDTPTEVLPCEDELTVSQNVSIQERLSIAVLSPDFRYHPVGRFWMPLHRYLNSCTNLHCISLNPASDSYTEQYKSASQSFNYISPLQPENVRSSLLRCSPDVVIDLAGHTADNCFPVLNHRSADLQVTYLGFFGPTFASEVDYWIVDRFIEPYLWHEPTIGEKRWQLPFCHLLYDPECHRAPASRPLPSGVSNLPQKCLRIGSFNHTRKLSDAFLTNISRMFALYTDHTACPTLIFKSHSFADPAMRRWFLQRLHQFGIPLSAIYLLPFASTDTSHFRDFATIDLHLDSFPICGTTTTFDSLVMHTPVLTTPNGLYAGSVSSGILSAFGMSDFILDSDKETITPELLHLLVQKQYESSFWPNYDSLLKTHLRESPRLFCEQLSEMLRSKRQ